MFEGRGIFLDLSILPSFVLFRSTVFSKFLSIFKNTIFFKNQGKIEFPGLYAELRWKDLLCWGGGRVNLKVTGMRKLGRAGLDKAC